MDASVQQEFLPTQRQYSCGDIVIICDQKLIIVSGLEDTL